MLKGYVCLSSLFSKSICSAKEDVVRITSQNSKCTSNLKEYYLLHIAVTSSKICRRSGYLCQCRLKINRLVNRERKKGNIVSIFTIY